MFDKFRVWQAAAPKMQNQFVVKDGSLTNQDGSKDLIVEPAGGIHPRKKVVKDFLRKIGLLVSAGLICIAAHAAEDSLTNRQGDITPLCGTKPMIVGVSDGYGGNTWRKTSLAEAKDELSHCKNVTRIIYSNANGDPQKANSDINSMVAQGINVLVMAPDFGAMQLPAMRSAMKAGVSVVPYSAQISGTPGRDYVVNVIGDPTEVGILWADWLGTNLKTGNVIFMGGSAGVAVSQNFMDGAGSIDAAIKAYVAAVKSKKFPSPEHSF